MATFNVSFLLVLLVENTYQMPKGLHYFVVLKVTEKEIWEAFPEFKVSDRSRKQLHTHMQRGKIKYKLDLREN